MGSRPFLFARPEDQSVARLGGFGAELTQSSISGLSSGAFMTVQMHLAHSACFVGAGIVAGGPFRCAESFREAALLGEDAFVENALYICMNPLIPQVGPNPAKLAAQARTTAATGVIDSTDHLRDDRIYIFTGKADTVVNPQVVQTTREFYRALGVPEENIRYCSDVDAGHSLITTNPEDNALPANRPPYLNNGGFMQSHDILRHIYGPLNEPSPLLRGQLIRFDQTEFFDHPRASMSSYGYAYVPPKADPDRPYRVHIALHGCKQGYNYINYVNGRPDIDNSPPYGNRYFTTTGYNEIADSNNLIILYPQVEGLDNGTTQNPDGCWDWWGYTCTDVENPDYYTRDAIQIRAIYRMLERLCSQ